MIGTVWQYSVGHNRAVIGQIPDGRFLVQIDGDRHADIMTQDEVIAARERDTKNFEYRQTEDEKAARLQACYDAKKAKDEDLGGFDCGMTPIQRGRVIKTLNRKFNCDGKIKTRRDMIRDMVENGAKIEERDGAEVLVGVDGWFFLPSVITKIGLDYARYLIQKG